MSFVPSSSKVILLTALSVLPSSSSPVEGVDGLSVSSPIIGDEGLVVVPPVDPPEPKLTTIPVPSVVFLTE